MLEGSKVKVRRVQKSDLEKLYSALEELVFSKEGFFYELESYPVFEGLFLQNGFFSEDGGLLVVADYKEHLLGVLVFAKNRLYDGYNLKFAIFSEKERSKGLMSEALGIFSEYFFQSKNINRLQLLIPNYQRAALKVAQKCGYKLEGVLKEALFFQGRFIDLCLYAKLRKERESYA
ncbi:MAG: GNAT family protein [Parachlamydiales bacterium]|jgi:RimJ/RimL family protein N-acetyltransferase